jgi:tetratricopeptide (TPR) repeat protein
MTSTPTKPDCWFVAHALVRAASRLVSTLALFSALLPAQPPLLQQAISAQQAGNYEQAAQTYRDYLTSNPNEVAARVNFGVVLSQLGRYDEAIAQYQAADKLLPGDPRIALNLALAYEKSGRISEAATRFAALHAADPANTQVTMLLADSRLQLGENDRVIALLQPLENDHPSDLGIAYMLGMAFLRTGRITEGQPLLDRILGSGDSAESRFLLGARMYESGDYPGAVKQLESAAALNPKVPELQAYYGQALLATGDPDAAAQAFQAELASNPNNYAANLGLGQILTVRKQFAQAVPLLERACLVRPESAEAKLTLEAARERRPAVSAGVTDFAPKVHDPAPDFTLADSASGKPVSLHQFRGKSPVVLIFGSYTCPNFRSAAASLKSMQQRYGSRIPFLLVYIREAHSTGDTNGNWQSTRNERDGVTLTPAATLADKRDHARMCSRTLHLPFPALVDGMDGAVETAYHAWPSRAFIIDRRGRVLYATRLTELTFHPAEMEAALRTQANGGPAHP